MNVEKTAAIDTDLPVGFKTRPAAMDDMQIVTDLLNAEAKETTGIEPFSVDECKREWTTPDFDLPGSSLMVISPENRLAGYAEVWDTGDAPVAAFVLGATHPDFANRGIGTSMMTWAEDRAKKTLNRLPSGTRFGFQAAVSGGYKPAEKLMESCGLEFIRTYFTMRLDLNGPRPNVKVPEGLTIEDLNTFGDAWTMLNTIEESFKDHFNHEEKTEDELRKILDHRLNDPNFDPSLWLVAHRDGEVLGALLGYPLSDEDPEVGHVGSLGVLRPYRRQGIGRVLLDHSFAIFSRRPQFKAVELGVDASNRTGATDLYVKAGMHVVRETHLFEKVLREAAV
ncbi:MAG: GNAT family N-acetyltransferase [Ardenticatenaceae bacterium]|nr:GNAT family N-acetyltransferase [Ardenticatenaceae bacterium]